MNEHYLLLGYNIGHFFVSENDEDENFKNRKVLS